MHDIPRSTVPRGITHALRAPLAAFSAALEVAQLPGVDDSDRARAFEVAGRQAHRLSELLAVLDAFIEMAGADAAQNTLLVDLASVCSEVPVCSSAAMMQMPSARGECVVRANPLLLLPALAGLQRHAAAGAALQALRVSRIGSTVLVASHEDMAPAQWPESARAKLEIELACRLVRQLGGHLDTGWAPDGRPGFEWHIPAAN